MNPLSVGICTQTPLLKFDPPAESTATVGGNGATASGVVAKRTHKLTPGGVCRMVLPTLRTWAHNGQLREAHWLSLQPNAPSVLAYDGLPLDIHHLTLPAAELAAYARTKEKLWADIHGLPAPEWGVDDFRFYARFNWFNADTLLENSRGLDVAYIHDFQLLQTGALVGLAAPSVLRWHVPFDPARIPAYTRNFLVRMMEDFDAVVVSTRRDLEGLLNAGFHGHARQLYPHIDSREWPDVTPAQIVELEERWGLRADDPLILLVARMDPMKRQDLAIQALVRLRRTHPRARLALVGNGSFSSAKQGGLGLSKADEWRAHLEALTARLGMQDAVVFARHIPDRLLAAAYARAQAVVLPSDIEGFGLTVLEGWRYSTPSVVSRGAGSAEVVSDGLTGLTFTPGDPAHLADQLAALLDAPDATLRMGEAGHAALRNYDAPEAAAREYDILQEAIARFKE